MSKRSRLWLTVTFGAICGLANPNLACSEDDSEPNWQFGESEMRDSVEGTYTLSDPVSGGSVTVNLKQDRPSATDAAGSAARLRCGNVNRSFIQPAGACDTYYSSEIVLTARIGSTLPQIASGQYPGRFVVDGTRLMDGRISIELGSLRVLEATFDAPEIGNWRLDTEGERLLLMSVSVSDAGSL
jgi:hypothetical protein